MRTAGEYAALKSRLEQIAGPDIYFKPTDWHRHLHADHSLGGWVHRNTEIQDDVHIDSEAVVCGGSSLKSGARIEGPSFIGPSVFVEDGSVIASSHVAVFKNLVYDFLDYDAQLLEVNGSHLQEADVIADGAIRKSTLGEGVRVRGTSVYIEDSTLDHAAEVSGSKRLNKVTRVTKSTVTDGAKIGSGVEFLNSRADGGALIEQPDTIQGEHVSDNRYASSQEKAKGLIQDTIFPNARRLPEPPASQLEKIK